MAVWVLLPKEHDRLVLLLQGVVKESWGYFTSEAASASRLYVLLILQA